MYSFCWLGVNVLSVLIRLVQPKMQFNWSLISLLSFSRNVNFDFSIRSVLAKASCKRIWACLSSVMSWMVINISGRLWMFMYEPETATLHLKVFLSDRRRLTVVSKLEKLFFVLNVSVIACLMGQALQSSPLPQPLFRELTQLSSSPTLLGCPESSVSVIA